jgi:hypothetical protein
MIGALTPAVIITALASKFAGVTAVWLIMAWRVRKQPSPAEAKPCGSCKMPRLSPHDPLPEDLR